MKLKTMLMGLLGAGALVAAPAFADRGHGHGHGHGHHKHHWKHHGHHHHHYRGHYHGYHARPVIVVPPPRVVYHAPAPVYYAPAPVYRHAPAYDSGSVSIRLNLPL